MSIFVICEAQGNGYRSSSLELLSQARRLSAGASVVAVVLGDEATSASVLQGAAHRVMAVEGAKVGPYSADAWTEALAGLLLNETPRLVLFGEGTRARDLLPRLAARLGAAAFTNALALELDGPSLVLTRPAYGGKAYVAIRCGDRLCLAAFRPNSFDAGAAPVAETAFETVQVSVAGSRVDLVEQRPRESTRVDLVEAQRVVAGGRGLKVPENLRLLEDLADALGGAVGVSRAVVDAGWADHAIQVGKSGKTISPSLYFAVGVSGAVHHTMGMDTAKVVVAINTDPKAPIFQYADYGIVGDALQVLPALTAAITRVVG
ncbi:MAG: electron transfer flavoprotein subunit alpha/FixB family protein [Deltaproteobacteria bacterium]|nr:electron transfer flavoprotein subunit alpha/FixB family protein [Deltaproteobacteria bacterium]